MMRFPTRSYPLNCSTTRHYSQVIAEHEESIEQTNLTVQMFLNLMACIYACYNYFWRVGDGLEGDAKCFALYRTSIVMFRPLSVNMFWLLTVNA